MGDDIKHVLRRFRITEKNCYYLLHFCLSVHPSSWNNSAPNWRISMRFDICIFFENVRKIQVTLKSDKNSRYFAWRPIEFMTISRPVLFRMKNDSEKFVEKIKTHILMFNNLFSQKSYYLLDKVIKYRTAGQVTDDNMARALCMLDT